MLLTSTSSTLAGETLLQLGYLPRVPSPCVPLSPVPAPGFAIAVKEQTSVPALKARHLEKSLAGWRKRKPARFTSSLLMSMSLNAIFCARQLGYLHSIAGGCHGDDVGNKRLS